MINQQHATDIEKDRFMSRVEQLKKVVEVCGTCNDKTSILTVYPDGKSLRTWAKTMRRDYYRMTRGE